MKFSIEEFDSPPRPFPSRAQWRRQHREIEDATSVVFRRVISLEAPALDTLQCIERKPIVKTLKRFVPLLTSAGSSCTRNDNPNTSQTWETYAFGGMKRNNEILLSHHQGNEKRNRESGRWEEIFSSPRSRKVSSSSKLRPFPPSALRPLIMWMFVSFARLLLYFWVLAAH
jgi:hypothetical protein